VRTLLLRKIKYKNTGYPGKYFGDKRGMFGKYGTSGGSRGQRALKRVSRDSDDDADVLLPVNNPVPFIGAFPPKELKYYDTWCDPLFINGETTLTNGNRTAAASGVNNRVIFNPSQGDSPSSRHGTRCIIKSLHIKFSIHLYAIDNGTYIPAARAVFIAIVHDRLTNGAACTASDIWINPGGSEQLLLSMHRNPFHGDRFTILRQCIVPMTVKNFQVLDIITPDQTASSGRVKHFEYFIPLDLMVNFKALAGAPGILDVIDHSFWVYAYDFPDGSTPITEFAPAMSIAYNARCRFITGT